MQHPSRQCSLRPVDWVKEDCFSLGHINKGVLPKGLRLVASSDRRRALSTCSVVEAIKLSCENNPPDGWGDKVCDLEAGRSLHTLLLRRNGPASCEQPPSLIATEPKVRAHTLPTPRSQEGELEAAHTMVASSALGSHANKAAEGYLAATTGEMRKDFVWDRQMANFPHGAPHFPEVILTTGTVELTHKPLKVNQVLRRQNGLARVDHTQVPIGLMSHTHVILGSHPRNESTSLPVWL